MKNLSKLHPLLFVLLFFIASFLLRIILISKGPYHLDCLALAINAKQTLETHQLYYQFCTGYPLTVLIGSFFIAATQWVIGDDPVFAVNFMSVVLSSLSVAIFYLFIKNIINTRSAFFGALLFSLHPIFLSLSVYGNSHIVCVFFLLLSLYTLTNPHQKFRYFFFSLFLGLMGAARLQDMILMLLPISIFWIAGHKNTPESFQRKILSLTLCFISALLIAALFHIPYLTHKTSSSYLSQFNVFWRIGLTSNFLGFFSAYFKRSIDIISFSTTLPNLLIAWFGLVKMFNKKSSLALLSLLWLCVPLFFYGNLLTSVPRFFLISIVPLCLMFGYGIDCLLYNKKLLFQYTLAAISITMLLVPNITNVFPILYFRHSYDLLPSWAKYVKDHTQPQALIITGDDELFLNHYAQRKTLYRPKAMNHLDENEFNTFKKTLADKLADNIPVYITTTGLSTYNPNGIFSNYIHDHYRLEYRATKTIEDWHSGELLLDKVKESLFRVYQK